MLRIALLTALAATLQAGEAPPPEFRVYPLGFADASNTVAGVGALLGADGKVFYDDTSRRLMVLAPSNRHAQVAALVRDLDIPPRNVRIEVRYRGQGLETESRASVNGQARGVFGPGTSRTTIRLQPSVVQESTTVNSTTAQQLLVASGRQASIFVGETVPYLEWIMDYGVRYGLITRQVAWQQVGAALVAEPFVIGDGPMIRVRLTPELSGLVNGNPYRTRFTTLATEVVVNDGVPFSLGGLSDNRDFYSHFLVGMSRSGVRQNLDIELTARIVPASGGP